MPDLDVLRKEAYEALEQAILKANAYAQATDAEEYDDADGAGEMVAVDAVLLIGAQWIDPEGDRCGITNIFPRHGWQPGYITAGLLTTAHARVVEP